ncbi:4'-phosphopantetheinyl transferase family protein [Arthrobacter sp. R4-81]
MRDTELGGVAVRAVALQAPSASELTLLDDLEHRRARRFVNPSDASAFLAGRLALRFFAAELAGVSPETLVADFQCPRCGGETADHGRPGYLLRGGDPGPLLSLSRTSGWVLLTGAVGGGSLGGVGVDAEKIGRTAFPGFDALVLTSHELSGLTSGTTAEGHRQRARLWARKEAFVKAIGEGLERDPASCDVTGDRLEGVSLADLDPERLGLPSGTVAALATLAGRP